MLTDAHCHPANLVRFFPGRENVPEDERRGLGVACASSATAPEEFELCEKLSAAAKTDSAAPVFPCFAVHPQMPRHLGPAFYEKRGPETGAEGLEFLEALAASGRLAAVGETGFDLFDAGFRETEKTQDALFAAHLDTALRHGLPLVLHVRRAVHKVFAHSAALKKCRAVVFHSWSGTLNDGEALLRRGINAFFSFGTVIALNHREAMRCCARFPVERLLTETDAPFQPLRGTGFSRYADLPRILETMAALRCEAGEPAANAGALEKSVEGNFRAVFLAADN